MSNNRFYEVPEDANTGGNLTIDLTNIVAISRQKVGIACVTQGGYRIWACQPIPLTTTEKAIDKKYEELVAQWKQALEQ